MKFIPYGRQDITDEDISAVTDVLRSDFLTQGPSVAAFEDAICEYVNVQHAIAVNSATSALHIACLAVGLSEGDWLWTTPNTFVASANCGRYCGANVDFVDIDSHTYNMSVDALKEKLVWAKQNNKLPKVIVPVDFSGQSCELLEMRKLADEYGFYIIEDASHAIGGSYRDKKIGCCEFSDITIFSFHPVKIITTAEGGMALTNNAEFAAKMQLFRSHGITRNNAQMTKPSDGDWYYQQIDLGLNYRMTDMQAILGVSQLKRIDAYVKRRHEIAKHYNERLANSSDIITPHQSPDSYNAYHLYPIVLKDEKERKRVFDTLRAKSIGVNVHYIPVHTQPYYQALGYKVGDYPKAEKYYSGAISLPMYATLTTEEQDYVIDTLLGCL